MAQTADYLTCFPLGFHGGLFCHSLQQSSLLPVWNLFRSLQIYPSPSGGVFSFQRYPISFIFFSLTGTRLCFFFSFHCSGLGGYLWKEKCSICFLLVWFTILDGLFLHGFNSSSPHGNPIFASLNFIISCISVSFLDMLCLSSSPVLDSV